MNRDPSQALPQIWIGYLLAVITLIAELVTAQLHPEMMKGAPLIPPLYLFLPAFVGGVYWLVCVRQYHIILREIPGWQHPISPGRAVWYHFIPIYNLYWLWRWPHEIARFVNWRIGRPMLKPSRVGFAIFGAFLVRFLLGPGLGMILLFVTASYLSAALRQAFAAPPPSAALNENSRPSSG
ncbi:MAG: hypothetical protein NVS9B4_20830 [Candidatus Acidiferrum sp.]